MEERYIGRGGEERIEGTGREGPGKERGRWDRGDGRWDRENGVGEIGVG